MKKAFLAVLLSLAAAWGAFAQAVNLDAAIRAAAEEMGGRLEKGIKIAVLNFSSTSIQMSAYVIDEINNALVNDGRLTVVDRQNLDLIRQELGFNDSEEVSNKSAQQIGRMLGAQLIVNGAMTIVGGTNRLRVQVLEVETAIIRYSTTVNIQNDQLVKSLMAGNSTGSSTAISTDQDFTTAERAGAIGLNLLFGAGSFWQKDKVGGAWTAALEGVGLVLFITGEVAISSVESNYGQNTNWLMVAGVRVVDILVAGGLAFYGSGFLVGTIRASTFHKPGYIASVVEPMNIALVSDTRGNAALRFSYSLKF